MITLTQTAPQFADASPRDASLDHNPTSVDPIAQINIEQEYAFRDHEKLRTRLQALFNAHEIFPGHGLRFERCGSDCWVQRSPSTGQVRTISNNCKLRICPRCRFIASRRIKRSLDTVLGKATPTEFRLITLTMRSSEAPLKVQIKNLLQSFRRLRQQKVWIATQDGGYAVLEITINKATERWHPHLHCVVKGRFVLQQDLAAAWKKATHGSQIVDIRKCRTNDGIIRYLTDYLCKPPADLESCDDAKLLDYYRAIQGQRFLIQFGKVPKLTKPAPSDDAITDWEPFRPLYQIIIAARQEQPWAVEILKLLNHERKPHERNRHQNTG